ncbi:tRNA (N6-threonylcarbamoyladenosine(37)-N6)-methyltransferase TrmO [Geoglobus ahangari]|nr:tRNA (N6-threonylcarbamoyladenosine(37)-N6)-methyltransferase TrmO [Geoglobus ahangari]
MNLIPIGEVVDCYPSRSDAPRQGAFGDRLCRIRIYEEFAEGLDGLERYDRLIILYWLHLSRRNVLKAKPPGSEEVRGVFSTRSPERPNPIGLAVVRLIEMSGSTLAVKGLDAVTGTPVIDIKPFLKDVDCRGVD